MFTTFKLSENAVLSSKILMISKETVGRVATAGSYPTPFVVGYPAFGGKPNLLLFFVELLDTICGVLYLLLSSVGRVATAGSYPTHAKHPSYFIVGYPAFGGKPDLLRFSENTSFECFVLSKDSTFVVLYEYKKRARFIPLMTINNTLWHLEL
jgi:hypothetical protein